MTTTTTTETIEQRAMRLWDREGGACVSHLVNTLAQGLGSDEAGTPLADLVYQAYELACPIDDWEEAATQEGWQEVSADQFELQPDDEEEPLVATSWENACTISDIEPYQREVFEHWVVSDWLADKLEARGEKVDKDFTGLTVWARTTCGQLIASDSVMEAIAADLLAEAAKWEA